MVRVGDADGMVAGAINSSANVLRAALQVVKTAPFTEIVSVNGYKGKRYGRKRMFRIR